MFNKFLYLFRFFGDFVPIMPILGVFYADSGMDLSQISLVFLTLAITVFVLEIPTGVLADRLSVKQVLITSRFFKLLAFSLIFAFPIFPAFLVAAVLWGIASSLDSGTWQSYLFTYSEKQNKLPFEKLYGRASAASFIGFLLATAAGTQIGFFGYAGLQIIGLVALFTSFLFAIFLPSQHAEQSLNQGEESPSVMKHFSVTIGGLLKHPVILTLLIIGVASGGVKGSLDEYTSLLLSDKGLSVEVLSYFLVALEILKSGSAAIAGNLPNKTFLQYLSLSVAGICLFVAGIMPSVIIVLVAFGILYIVDTYLWIHNDTALQKNVSNKQRATVASLKNFGTELTAFTLFIFGVFIKDLPITYLYMGGGLVLFIIGLSTGFIKILGKRTA